MKTALITFFIIAILAIAAALPIALSPMRCYTHLPRNDLSAISTMLALYKLDYGVYPQTLGELVTNTEMGPYLNNIPNDPWRRPYIYNVDRLQKTFVLFSLGADGTEGGINQDSDVFLRAGK